MNLSDLELKPSDSIKKAISAIEIGNAQFAYVVDSEKKIIGTITDGDIRRALIRGDTLEASVDTIMFTEFRSLPANATESEAKSLMRREVLQQVPGLDEQGRVVRLFLLEEIIKPTIRPNSVIIMAGGEGKRLLPYTEDCPKPMLLVGGKPMLEIILEQCVEAGFQDFHFSVNYLKHQIMDYFGDGERWGIQISYLEEDQPLGTAGALGNLTKAYSSPLLLLNGDVLTRVNYGQLMQFHEEHDVSATMCVREYKTQVPYGVVELNDLHLVRIREKPVFRHYVNAGIYVLEPALLELIPKDHFFDMPQLLEKAIEHKHSVCAFPIHEYWLDIGHHDTFETANQSWSQG